MNTFDPDPDNRYPCHNRIFICPASILPLAGSDGASHYTAAVSLDRAFSLVFRNFATLFLLAASLTVPLHVAVSYSHRDVIAVRDIHDDIGRFPEDQRVRGVGRDEVDAYRSSGPILVLIEAAAIPILVGAAVQVFERDLAGRVPSVWDAWRAGFAGLRRLRPRNLELWLAGAVTALTIAVLGRLALLIAAEPLPDEVAWAGRALAEGLSRALGAPFLLGAAALAAKGAPHGAPTA